MKFDLENPDHCTLVPYMAANRIKTQRTEIERLKKRLAWMCNHLRDQCDYVWEHIGEDNPEIAKWWENEGVHLVKEK